MPQSVILFFVFFKYDFSLIQKKAMHYFKEK